MKHRPNSRRRRSSTRSVLRRRLLPELRPATPYAARLGRSGGSGQRGIRRVLSERLPLRMQPPFALLPICP